MSAGYVYILSNPAMPGLVKIGRSKHGGKQRASELFQTGTPSRFTLEFEILVDDPAETESDAHSILNEYRVSTLREFFRVGLDTAITAVLKAYANSIALDVVFCGDMISAKPLVEIDVSDLA